MNSLASKLFGCTLLAFTFGSEVQAKEPSFQVKWTQLAEQITGRKISVLLTDGARVEGRAGAVAENALVLNGSKGDTSVPRSQVRSVRVSKPGWKWRVIGPIVGAISIGITGAQIGHRIDPYGGIPFGPSDGAAKGLGVGGIVGLGSGYILGDFADQHHVTIEIIE